MKTFSPKYKKLINREQPYTKENNKVELSIIIVSYNTKDLIGTCLDSILNTNDCGKEIIIVDNASSDGSAEVIRNNYPSVHLIKNGTNRGFGAANNQALKL